MELKSHRTFAELNVETNGVSVLHAQGPYNTHFTPVVVEIHKTIMGIKHRWYTSMILLWTQDIQLKEIRESGFMLFILWTSRSVHTIQFCWVHFSSDGCHIICRLATCMRSLSMTDYIPYVRSELDPRKLDCVNRPLHVLPVAIRKEINVTGSLFEFWSCVRELTLPISL